MSGEQADFLTESMMIADEEEDTAVPRDASPHGPGDCPRCGGPTHLVTKGPYGSFYGCNSFPKCTGSRSFRG